MDCQSGSQLAELDSIVRWIGYRQTSFINKLLKQSREMNGAPRSQYLMHELEKRNTILMATAKSRFGKKRWASVVNLYHRFEQLVSFSGWGQSSTARCNSPQTSLVLSINDYYAVPNDLQLSPKQSNL